MTDFPVLGLLFDSDGVLVDSHEAAALAWNDWATTWAPTFDFHRDIVHGRRLGDSVATLVPTASFAEAEAALVALELETVAHVGAMPGAVALFESLPAGTAVVVTSALRSLALARLAAAGLGEPAALVTAEDVTHGKPDPEPYLRGARLLDLDPVHCVVFEDAPAGIAAALAAGVGTVVGIGAAAVGAGAHVVVPDLRAVSYADGVLTIDDAVRLDLSAG
jgi:sugar-phosphatase